MQQQEIDDINAKLANLYSQRDQLNVAIAGYETQLADLTALKDHTDSFP
jgi:hypothetical protein